MNTYVGITPTGIVIVRHNTIDGAVEKFRTLRHRILSIHIMQAGVLDIWSHGKESANFRIHHLI